MLQGDTMKSKSHAARARAHKYTHTHTQRHAGAHTHFDVAVAGARDACKSGKPRRAGRPSQPATAGLGSGPAIGATKDHDNVGTLRQEWHSSARVALLPVIHGLPEIRKPVQDFMEAPISSTIIGVL
jgi:hypothetical protein